MKQESYLMKFLRELGIDSLAWSLRRLHCPVKKNDLVLEIGSGGNPYPRANILCDAYLETMERHFDPLVHDRPTILAFTENLPFKDNVFDFVIASHVLEHSSNPDKFLAEIQRVGKAGYIETPSAFFERLCHYPMHRLEIENKNNELLIYKKTGQIEDKYLSRLFLEVSAIFSEWVSSHPFNFHVRYYWNKDIGGIKYKILNPGYKFDWNAPLPQKELIPPKSCKNKIRTFIIFLLRDFLSQNKRNERLDLLDYLKCLKCGGKKLERGESDVHCVRCDYSYKIVDKNIIDFINN